ncbi:MAG: FAD-binding protein [Chloroflexi bacterium]|nr:FAD-binding protein [Chloroflexota bacterium]
MIAGAGLAGLTAALAARSVGARVLVLEAAPPSLRGGSTRLSDGIFSAGFDPDPVAIERGPLDADLPKTLASAAAATLGWLGSHEISLRELRFDPVVGAPASGGLPLRQSLGGGPGLSSRLFELAQRHGIRVRYESRLADIEHEGSRLTAAVVQSPQGRRSLPCRTIVLATGGFGASSELRARYLGACWSSAKTAGSRFNLGDGLRLALVRGAVATGDFGSCVAWPWEATAPPFGEPERPDVFRRLAGGLGLLVNQLGLRCTDAVAGSSIAEQAQLARAIIAQPGGIAFQIFDGSVQPPILPASYAVTSARSGATVEELAIHLALPPAALHATVAAFNQVVERPSVGADTPGRSFGDGWAPRPLRMAPFAGHPVTTAVVATFGGIRTSTVSHVLSIWDRPIPGLFAAGEVVGGLFAGSYPDGAALTAAAVFGRRAGLAAAKAALQLPPTFDPADPEAERWLLATRSNDRAEG